MKTYEIKGELRKTTGKTDSRKLRKDGKMPCVMYGGKENVHFSVEKASLKKLIYTPEVQLVNIEIEGKKHNAIIKDMQFHAVTDELSHLDFLEIHDDKPIEIGIPVELTGIAPGVRAGGKLHLVNRKLKVKGLAKNLPDKLLVDINDLNLGKSIKVGDLSFEHIAVLNSKNTVVASVKLTRASKGTEAEGTTEGAAEGTEQKKAEE
jgi:large subunit ribosomal protein L25